MVAFVPAPDARFRIAVTLAALVLVAVMASIRFCGSVSLPPKPAPPAPTPTGTSSELLTQSSASSAVYQDLLARDAAAAGVRAPTLEEMSRRLSYRDDATRRVLEVGAAPVEVAGVRLRAVRLPEGLGLEIANATGSDIAYQVVTEPVPAASCQSAAALSFNAMTIGRGRTAVRVECAWREGIALAVTRVETLELSPLSAWYVDHVPPAVVGIDRRVARAHHTPEITERCAFTLSQAVRSGLERGEIGWRDLVDFYARHRCQTYQFPLGYRALERDGERSLPAVSARM